MTDPQADRTAPPTTVNEAAERMLASYEPPPLDPAIDEALAGYVARRKAEMPDAFN